MDEDQLEALLAGSAAAGASSSGVAPETTGGLPASSGPLAGQEIIAPNNDETATSTPTAANDNGPTSAQEIGHEHEEDHNQQADAEAEPDDPPIAHQSAPLQEGLAEPANDNPPPDSGEVPATGTE